MRRILTTSRIVIFGIILLLAAGYIGGTNYLNSAGFRHMVLLKVNATIDGQLSITQHHLALLSGKLALSGVELTDQQGKMLVSAQQMHLQLSWPALLWQHVRIKTLTIEKALVHLRYDHQDRLALIKAKPAYPSTPSSEKEKSENKWFLSIDDSRLNRGELHFERPSKGWSARVAGIEMAAGIHLQQRSGQVHISAGPLHWQQPEATRNLASLKLRASLDADQTIALKVQLPHTEVDVKGRLPLDTKNSLMNLIVNLNLDLDAVKAWLPETATMKGHLKAHLTAQGRLEDPTVAVEALWTNGEAMDVPFERFTADLRLHQGRIDINDVSSKSFWGSLHFTGKIDLPPGLIGNLKPAAAQWDTLGYDLKLKATNLRPAQVSLLDYFPKGTFQLSGQMTGGGLTSPQAHGQARIEVDATELFLHSSAESTNGHLDAKLQWKGPEMELSAFKASIGGHVLDATARLNLSAEFIDQAKANFKTNHIEELGALLGIQLPLGSGEINVQCQGPFRHPTANIKLLGQQLAFGKRPIGRLLAEALLNDKGVLSIPRMTLENQGSLVQGSGQLALRQANGNWAADPGMALDLAFEQLAPADFGFLPSMEGHLNGQLQLNGSLGNLKSRVVLAESPVRWSGLAGHVKGKGSWEDGRLVIQDLNLFNKASAVRLQGSAAWRQPGSRQWSATPDVQATIEGQDILLEDFSQDIQGTLTLHGQVTGIASDLKGRFEVLGNKLVIGKQPIKQFTLQGHLTGGKVFCDNLKIDVQKDQMIQAKGWYGFNRQLQFDLETADFGLGHIVSLQQAYPLNGNLNLQLMASGHIENPQLHVDLKVRQPRLKDQLFDDFYMNAELSNHQLTLAANLNFDLKAHYQMDKGGFNLQAHFDRSDLSPYLALWAGKQWGGILSGRLEARGNRFRPEQIQGELSITNAELHHRKQSIINVPQLHVRLKDQYLEVPNSRLALLDNGFINLAAKGRLPDHLMVTSDGRVPVAALVPFIPSIENAQGALLFKARAKGVLTDMQWHADLDLNKVGFDLPGLGQPFEDLGGRLQITPHKLTVQDLSGHMGEGRFTLAGMVQFKKWLPVEGQLNLNAYALPLQWPGTMDVVINSDITLEGAAESPQLTGKLALVEGSYFKDVRLNLLSAVTLPRRSGPTPASTYTMPAPLGKIALNVDVAYRSPLLVDNNLANLEIAPDLKISGTLARPIVSGRAQVTAGEVVFRGKTFIIQRGVVDFINPYKIEPNLDILAQATIRQWEVSLSLSGTPDRLLVNLESVPDVPENDILSLILLGRTSTEVSQGEGGQTTQQMLASLMGMAIGEDIKKISGLDILEVETGSQDESQSADRTQLTVGKRLSRRLTIKYEVESGDEEMVQRAVSEYRFLEHLLASGFQNSKGEYGSELLFRIEF